MQDHGNGGDDEDETLDGGQLNTEPQNRIIIVANQRLTAGFAGLAAV